MNLNQGKSMISNHQTKTSTTQVQVHNNYGYLIYITCLSFCFTDVCLLKKLISGITTIHMEKQRGTWNEAYKQHEHYFYNVAEAMQIKELIMSDNWQLSNSK